MLFFLKNCSFLLFFVLKNAMTVAKRLAALSTVQLTLPVDVIGDRAVNSETLASVFEKNRNLRDIIETNF